MRIAFIVGQFPSLSETFILNQITGLIDRGHEVDIYACRKSNDSKIHPDVRKYDLLSRTYYLQCPPVNKVRRLIKAIGLIIANFQMKPMAILRSLNVFKYGKAALSFKLLYLISPFLDKKSYDIIHCHFGTIGNLGVLLKELGAIEGKVVTTFHGFDMSIYIRKHGCDVYETLFDKGALFLPISKNWSEKLVKMGFDEQKIVVHRMGIDINKFQFVKREKRSSIQLLTIARFVEKKGIEYGIRAVAWVLKKQPNIEYKIAGDGPLRSHLEHLIEELGVRSNVKLLGWQSQDEIRRLMQESDIIIAPSVASTEGDQEGIPVTLMEALATGLPVIATKHSGIPELVQEGKSGFLVPERDVDALIEKLEYLIEHSEIWQEMGSAGRRYVEENYDIRKLNDRLVEIYQKLIDGDIP